MVRFNYVSINHIDIHWSTTLDEFTPNKCTLYSNREVLGDSYMLINLLHVSLSLNRMKYILESSINSGTWKRNLWIFPQVLWTIEFGSNDSNTKAFKNMWRGVWKSMCSTTLLSVRCFKANFGLATRSHMKLSFCLMTRFQEQFCHYLIMNIFFLKNGM